MYRVEVRSTEGEARIAGHRVAIAGEERRLRLLGPDGATLRPLSFGERGRLARAVGSGENTPAALARLVADRAALHLSSGAPSLTVQILALHLAGAGSGAPGFAEEVGILGRWLGWPPGALDGSDAAEVDALALSYVEAERRERGGGEEADAEGSDDGWVSLVLDGPSRGTGGGRGHGESLEAVRNFLAEDLLVRARKLPDLKLLGGLHAARVATGRQADRRTGDRAPQAAGSSRTEAATHPDAPAAAGDIGLEEGGTEREGEAPRAAAPLGEAASGRRRRHERPASDRSIPAATAPRQQPDHTRAARAELDTAPVPVPSAAPPRSWSPGASPSPSELAPASELARFYPAIFRDVSPDRPRPVGPGTSGELSPPAVSRMAAELWARCGVGPTVAAGGQPSGGAPGVSHRGAPPLEPAWAPLAGTSDAAFALAEVADALQRAADLRGMAP